MDLNTNLIINGKRVREFRQIKITAKRQVTIPKRFFDLLGINDKDSLQAYVVDGWILMKPHRSQETLADDDKRTIISKVIAKGYTGEDLVDEILYRLNEYEDLLADRVQEFEKDIAESNKAGTPPEEGDFNGLEIFFDEETGADSKDTGKKAKKTT